MIQTGGTTCIYLMVLNQTGLWTVQRGRSPGAFVPMTLENRK
jgi:hypothetical protein